jgi:cell division protein FtsB
MSDETGREEADLEAVEVDNKEESEPSARRPSWERPTRIAVSSLALVAIMFLFVFPTRSYLGQQRQVRAARHAVQVLELQNNRLRRQAKLLQTPVEIERLARVQFNMVFPGEHAFNVVTPADPAPTDAAAAATP